MTTASLIIRPGTVRGGVLAVPGDKSVSHRALILSALADGETKIHGFLDSADCLATAEALRQLGVSVRMANAASHESEVIVSGVGLHGLKKNIESINCGNSGTAMRLLAGVLSGQPFTSTLIGDESLSRRPMRRVADPLASMGANIRTAPNGTPPLRVAGYRPLHAIDYRLPVASAQVKSAILLAGLYADAPVRVTEPDVSRDHSERMLGAFGVSLKRTGSSISISPPQKLVTPGAIDVPGDLSSAAFFLVLGAIVPGCRIELSNVGINPTRDGILRLLGRMGASVAIRHRGETRGGEPVADLIVEASQLQGIDVSAADVALAIDEIPVLLIAAACATGRTVIRGAAELRVKESDRLHAMAAGLRAQDIAVEEFADGIAVEGGRLRGGEVDSDGDHRVAMAFAVAGAVAEGETRIRNTENIATSYPGFVADARRLGLEIEAGQE